METKKTQKRKANCKGQHRKIIDSTDSEDSEADNDNLKRKSVRISNKRNKPEFQLPSRDEIWKNIPSMKEELSLKRLTPNKTVNNYTKIYNDYNFDDYEDTSESISTDENSEEEETFSRQAKKHRISRYYSRIVKVSSSDEEQTKESPTPQGTHTPSPSKGPDTDDTIPDKGNIQELEKHKKCEGSESDVSSSPGRPKRTRVKKKLYAFPVSEDEENDL